MATPSGNTTHTPPPLLIRAAAHENATPPPTGTAVTVRSGRKLRLGQARDVAGALVEVQADDVVRVEYDLRLDDGGAVVHWVRADELLRERGHKAVTRSDGSEVWDIDAQPRFGAYRTDVEPATERGALGLGIKVLEFFGVAVTQGSARTLGATFERKQLGREPGLYRVALTPEIGLSPVGAPALRVTPGQPVLVFLHGTMSSFSGSFKDLASNAADESGQAARSLRALVAERYQGAVYAWEHRSLTESPIENALALIETLPADTELHLVSHSRGGLIGELLCLGQRDKRDDPLRTDQIENLFAADHTLAEQLGLGPLDSEAAEARDKAYDADRKRLTKLLKALEKKRIQVTRFVRVACPARGTTLASGRLDRWLSVLNLVMPGGLFGDVADFLLAVVKERTDPRTLPGIEAMMPGSALTRLLHLPDLVTTADLSVIAGDVEGEGLWAKLKLLALDWFYAADHDLVVNTGSMTGGIARVQMAARYLLHKHQDVNHFRYFRNKTSIDWLAAALLRADGSDAGFMPIGEAKVEEPRWRSAVRNSRSLTSPRPLAILVPGTMGSALSVHDRPVWLRYWALMKGGLGHIDIDAGGVQPIDVLDNFYGPLLEHLTRTHKVDICPYDWRLSVRAAARLLAGKIEVLLREAERTRQPVHIVAHSMGGLVARAMIADETDGGAQIWRRMTAVPGSRLLMLGTPNRGSHEAVRWLTGFNPTQAKLSLLDFTRGTNGVIDIVRRFPGLAELLPFHAEPNPWARIETWRALKQELRAGWTAVDEAALREAQTTWALLRDRAVDPKHMIYVAGCHPATVVDHAVVDDEYTYSRRRLQWIATGAGDGTVTWASGQLAEVPMYYAPDTGHDQLCSNDGDRRIFRGYVDLLLTGRTDQLLSTPPARRRDAAAADDRFVLPDLPAYDDLPDAASLQTFGFGGTRGRVRDAGSTPGNAPLEVRILHGDLAYVSHPVLVGHYTGDTIVSAEAALDARLRSDDAQGPLSRRRDLGLYPGPLGTHEVFFNEHPPRKPDGALVVGLGQVGELSPGRLEAGVRDLLLEYALQLLQRDALRAEPAVTRARISAGVSALLVGTGAGGLGLRDSLEAMLRGALAANRKLEDAKLDQRVRIDRIEFVELYEDVAIGAANELASLLKGSDLGARAVWHSRYVEAGEGRRRRTRFDADPSWWQRVEITEDRKADRLRFVIMGDRARAEETLAFGQLRLADSFIAQACGSARASSDLSKTLFEMLLPNRLKESAPDQRPMVLLLDEQSARFPWELLEDRWSQLGRPPAVVAGMVRQLKVLEFRAQSVHPVENTVYVVGNPDLGGWERFADLPGARHEAEQVRKLFRERGYDVSAAIDQSTQTIVDGLYAKGWRVLHLAGHGEHEFDIAEPAPATAAERAVAPSQQVVLPDGTLAIPVPQTKTLSGMLVGKGVFLTPGDVAQMRYVPEVVFINCCHLGKAGGAPARYNRLAANLGIEFIRMGVRAVVCAGWAVDDAAAVTFAETFYVRLLDGETFGDAVLAARHATWHAHPDSNTWGAYQCYGDAGYRLVHDHHDRPHTARPDFFAPAELVAEARNLAEQTRMEARETGADEVSLQHALRRRIDGLIARIPESAREPGRDAWLERADVCAAIGFAYGEGRMFLEAVEWLEKALVSSRGECPIRAAEQCANFEIRLAGREWAALRAIRGAAADEAHLQVRRNEIAGRIERAMAELDFINHRAATAERLSLLGSACKRLAWVQSGQARFDTLRRMAAYYRRAYEHEALVYPFANWALAVVLLRHHGRQHADDPSPEVLSALREQLAETTRARTDVTPSFWQACGLADLQVLELLMSVDDPERCAALATSAADQFGAAFVRGASLREIASVQENLDFLIELTGDLDQPWPQAVRDALDVIRRVCR